MMNLELSKELHRDTRKIHSNNNVIFTEEIQNYVYRMYKKVENPSSNENTRISL